MFETDIDDNSLSLTRFNKADKRFINMFSNKFENYVNDMEKNYNRSSKKLGKKLEVKFQFAAMQAGIYAFKLTGKVAPLVNIVTSVDMVCGLIYAGAEAVDTLLFSIVKSVVGGNDVTKDMINKMLKTLVEGHKMAVKIQSEEYDKEASDQAIEGIQEFEENINSILTPYKI